MQSDLSLVPGGKGDIGMFKNIKDAFLYIVLLILAGLLILGYFGICIPVVVFALIIYMIVLLYWRIFHPQKYHEHVGNLISYGPEPPFLD